MCLSATNEVKISLSLQLEETDVAYRFLGTLILSSLLSNLLGGVTSVSLFNMLIYG